MSANPEISHLVVEAGPDQGRRFTIPAAGARLGRSSGNDIVLLDPALSRFHCRLFFKPDGTLWLNDLGSTNATLVNGQAAADNALQTGDLLEMGETRIRILHNRLDSAPAGADAPPARIDLGLARGADPESAPATPRPAGGASSKPPLLLAMAAIVVVAAAALFLLSPWKTSRGNSVSAPAPQPPQPAAFDLLYEKEEGSSSNLFRYVLALREQRLSVRIDDAGSGRHVTRDKRLAPEVIQGLAAELERLSVFDLNADYLGVAPESAWSLRDLTLTLGSRTHRIRVLNRLEPEAFEPVREAIETFAQNELGLIALSLPPERLLELARDALQLGHKALDERDVRPDNLFQAVRAFDSCRWYLETVEPKPPFYEEAAAGAERARRELERDYQALLFESEKAWNLSDWPRAAEQFRQILALIPDRSDDRHLNARKKLLDVERRLGR